MIQGRAVTEGHITKVEVTVRITKISVQEIIFQLYLGLGRSFVEIVICDHDLRSSFQDQGIGANSHIHVGVIIFTRLQLG